MIFVAFTGVHSLGQSFMDWSFLYLTGNKTFWNAKQGTLHLVDDPMTNINAHAHVKNHPEGMEDYNEFVAKARSQTNTKIITVYPTVDGFKAGEDTLNRYEDLMTFFKQEGYKIFTINQTKPYPYMIERSGYDTEGKQSSIYIACRLFYKGTVDVDPKDIKTMREMVSFRILKNREDWLKSCKEFYEKVNPLVDGQFTDVEWTTQTERCITQVIKDTGQHMAQDRFERWVGIMGRWQVAMKKMAHRYENEIPMIAESIVTAKDLDLGSFNLTTLEQALIMAHLMRDHGRRLILPSEKFPKNAKELHRFLK